MVDFKEMLKRDKAKREAQEDPVDKSQWVEPTGPERERLYVLAEELMEVALEAGQMAMKTLRFGFDETYPGQFTDLSIEENRRKFLTNNERLEQEIGDVLGIVQLMIEAGDVSEVNIDEARALKMGKMKTYTKRQGT